MHEFERRDSDPPSSHVVTPEAAPSTTAEYLFGKDLIERVSCLQALHNQEREGRSYEIKQILGAYDKSESVAELMFKSRDFINATSLHNEIKESASKLKVDPDQLKLDLSRALLARSFEIFSDCFSNRSKGLLSNGTTEAGISTFERKFLEFVIRFPLVSCDDVPLRVSLDEPFEEQIWAIQEALLDLQDSVMTISGSFSEIGQRVSAAKRLLLLRGLPQFVDLEQISRNSERYGAKAGLLIAVSELSKVFNGDQKYADLRFDVLPFEPVETALFERDRAGGDISVDLDKIWARWKGKDIIIRSSALRAEDGEHMGAGIYESVGVSKQAEFPDFCQAVRIVYDSVDSELARAYRARMGISEQEKMGLVIAEFLDPYANACDDYVEVEKGYVNGQRAHVSKLSDVVIEGSCREESQFRNDKLFTVDIYRSTLTVMNREAFLEYGDRERDVYPIPFDHAGEFIPTSLLETALKNNLAIEFAFGRPVQTEFLSCNCRLILNQARPLPKGWLTPNAVSFPTHKQHIFACQSLGVVDRELEVLSDEDNGQRTGVVVFNSGYFGSRHTAWIERVLPKEGAIILIAPSEEYRGHIETRALERGLTILGGRECDGVSSEAEEFLSLLEEKPVISRESRSWGGIYDRGPQLLVPRKDSITSLRVVSDGVSARVYLPDLV